MTDNNRPHCAWRWQRWLGRHVDARVKISNAFARGRHVVWLCC